MQNSQRARSVLKKVNDRPQSDRSNPTSQRFELQFSCENLVNQLAVGQPKPQVLVFLNGKLHDETEVGNGLSPSFSKKIECDYEFGKPQDLTVIVRNTIWHIIPRGEKKMTFGRAKISLDVILQQGSKGAKLKLRAAPSDKEKIQGLKYADGGRIYINAYPDNPDQARFRVSAFLRGVPKNMFSYPEVFLEFTIPEERNRLLHRSENQKAKRGDVSFLNFNCTEGRLSDFDTPINASLYEYEEDGRIKLKRKNELSFKSFGACQFRPTQLFETGGGSFQLSKSTVLEIKDAKYIAASHSTFYDFMHAGLKLKFRLAIDFSTFSLSDHNAEQSPYEDSIRALGRIMQNYDDDGKIPTYAYCNTPTNGDAEFWQMLNEKGDHEINLSELLEIYYENVDNHSFEDGPVNCSRLIESFLKEIGGGYTGEADEYHVVVLLSSGKCDDIEEIIDTMEQQAVHLPFSLIVVGVGDNSFLAWEQLGKKLKKSSIRSLDTFFSTLDVEIPSYEDIEERNQLEQEFVDEFESDSDEEDVLAASLKGHPKLREVKSQATQLKYNKMLENVSKEVMKNIPKQVERFYSDRQIKPIRGKQLRSGTINSKPGDYGSM